MKNLITVLREMEFYSQQELDKYFPFLSQKINELILKINKSANFEETDLYFALLERIQDLFIKIQHLNNFKLPKYLWDFTRDFERIDDLETQKIIFKKIKNNQYKLIKID